MNYHRLTLPSILLFMLLLLGSLGYVYIENWSFEDGLTMTIHTITTLGLKEIQPLSRAGLQFTNVLVIIGVIVLMYSLGVVGEVFITGKIEKIFGKRGHSRMLSKLKDHYIICGYGRLGRVVSAELSNNHEKVVVIEQIDCSNEINGNNITHYTGDATKDESLIQCNIKEAKGLITTVGEDADNVFIVLSARGLNPQLSIITLSDKKHSYSKLRQAGADNVINPFEIGGTRLALSLLKPTACQFMETVMKGKITDNIHVDEIHLNPSHPWLGLSLKDIPPREISLVNILSVKRGNGEMLYFPKSDMLFEKDDILVVLGDKNHIKKLSV